MKNKITIFILGCLCFIISQPILRLSLLNYLQGNTKFILLYRLNPLFIGIMIAFSAGLFEESFRFLFRNFIIGPPKIGMLEPLIFGLGHGITEAIIVLGPHIFIVPFQSLALGLIERFLAIILHVGLTIVIWNGFILNKKFKYLGIAILIHGLTNSLIPILISVNNGIILIEVLLLLIDIFIIGYIYKSRKYYSREKVYE